MDKTRNFAAVFIDFENFFYSLTNLYELPYEDAGEVAVVLIANQIEKLKKECGEIIIRQAFADWRSMQVFRVYDKIDLQHSVLNEFPANPYSVFNQFSHYGE